MRLGVPTMNELCTDEPTKYWILRYTVNQGNVVRAGQFRHRYPKILYSHGPLSLQHIKRPSKQNADEIFFRF